MSPAALEQRRLLSRPEPLGQLPRDRQGQGDRPSVELAVVLDHRLVEHAIICGRVHWARQRADAAIAQAINGRQVGVGDVYLRQGFGLGEKVWDSISGHSSANRFRQAAVRGHEASHS